MIFHPQPQLGSWSSFLGSPENPTLGARKAWDKAPQARSLGLLWPPPSILDPRERVERSRGHPPTPYSGSKSASDLGEPQLSWITSSLEQETQSLTRGLPYLRGTVTAADLEGALDSSLSGSQFTAPVASFAKWGNSCFPGSLWE